MECHDLVVSFTPVETRHEHIDFAIRDLTVVERSVSSPLQAAISHPCWLDMHPKSVCYKYVDLAAKLLPRVSQLIVITGGGCDTPRMCRAFKDRTTNQLRQFTFIAPPKYTLPFLLTTLHQLPLDHVASQNPSPPVAGDLNERRNGPDELRKSDAEELDKEDEREKTIASVRGWSSKGSVTSLMYVTLSPLKCSWECTVSDMTVNENPRARG